MDSVEATAITIKWKRVPKADENSPDEEYLNYIVRYKKSRSQDEVFTCIGITGSNTWHRTNLEESTQYMIQVAVEENGRRIGDYSEPLNVTTDRGEYKNSYLSI